MKTKSNNISNITEMPKAEEPERRFFGFYFDSLGRMNYIEEGLSEVEKLALITYAHDFLNSESQEICERLRKGDGELRMRESL